MTDLGARLATGDITLMDGAMGTELERRGVAMDDDAWCGAAMAEHGDIVRTIHQDYVRAGAEIHIVNSFALARHTLELVGFGDRVADFNRHAVALCREAIAQSDRPAWIAGSLSTFVDAHYRVPLPAGATLRANFDEQAGVLRDAGCDLYCLEMLYDVEISLAAIGATAATGAPVSVGFCCSLADDSETVLAGVGKMNISEYRRFGDVLADLIPELPSTVETVMTVMHSRFDVTDRALDVLAAAWPGPIGVYPNSGSFRPPNWDFDEVSTAHEFAAAAARWAAKGATVIGGCCGIGPDHIAAARARLTPCAVTSTSWS